MIAEYFTRRDAEIYASELTQTPSHFCKDTPSVSCGGYEHVARGSHGRLKIFETQNSRVLLSTT